MNRQDLYCRYSILSGMLKHANGRTTDTHINHCAVMSGEWGKTVDQQLRKALGMSPGEDHSKDHDTYKADRVALVELLCDEAVFDYCPPRSHRMYERFKRWSMIRNPEKLGQHIHALCKSLDFWRRREIRAMRD